ncbi:MAG: LysM peptidoglycan-binding domain-containing protein [Clostridiales bacterium]|nr:LysM peptidoglycan-binding domain-containing protein [Clostridiales bacterium]
MTEFKGIDVSEWQETIDFDAVKNDGVDIVYIRAGAGSAHRDPYLDKNYSGAVSAGLKIGFYHYVTARSAAQAANQAAFFAGLISDKVYDCRLAMDFEDLSGLSVGDISTISAKFLNTLKSFGHRDLVIYSDAFNAKESFGGSLTKYPLWIAQYGVKYPSSDINWKNWAGWQYTDTGKVNGINGNVDMDVFHPGIFRGFPGNIINKATGKKYIYYTVKKGDTLTRIAKKYKTTVSALVKANGIKNPDIIYTGQTLRIPVKAS